MRDNKKRILIEIDDKRHLTYQANFKDLSTMLNMVQIVLSVMSSKIAKQRLN